MLSKSRIAVAVPFPVRRGYKPEVKPTSFAELPFVDRPKRGSKKSSNWHVPPTDDYDQANNIGREYAAHLTQYLKDNPDMVGSGLLGHIVKDIDFTDASMAKGYWVGFFLYLERLIYAQAQRMDVYGDVDRVNAHHAGLAAQRDTELRQGADHA